MPLTNLKSIFMLLSMRPSPLGVNNSDHFSLFLGSCEAKFCIQLVRADSA